MARQSTLPAPLPASLSQWILLILLATCGGSAFAGINYAIETAPPSVVAAGRLWISAVMLVLYAKLTGRPMIPLRSETGSINTVWVYAAVIGIVGYTIPMTLFPLAQQSVSSLLAGIYMATMPLMTIFLAASFAAEPLTVRKLIGFCIGTLGIFILIGQDVIGDMFGASVLAQGMLLLANLCYAVTSVVMRRAPEAPVRSFAAAFMLAGAIAATPSALIDLTRAAPISGSSWLAIIYLGVVPTGITAILIVNIIRNVGAGFMAMANYLTPLFAIAFGIILFSEILYPRYALGLVVILAALAIAQPGPLEAIGRRLGWVKPAGPLPPGDK